MEHTAESSMDIYITWFFFLLSLLLEYELWERGWGVGEFREAKRASEGERGVGVLCSISLIFQNLSPLPIFAWGKKLWLMAFIFCQGGFVWNKSVIKRCSGLVFLYYTRQYEHLPGKRLNVGYLQPTFLVIGHVHVENVLFFLWFFKHIYVYSKCHFVLASFIWFIFDYY